MQDIETLIIKGGFELKEWIFSRDSGNSKKYLPNESNVATEKVLGVNWDPINHHCAFQQSLTSFRIGNAEYKKRILITIRNSHHHLRS